MNFENKYWFFTSQLTKHFCKNVIEYANKQKEEQALTGGQTEKVNKGEKLTELDFKNLKNKRDSSVVWLNDQWLYNEIFPYIEIANKNAGWNFDIDWAESMQFTKYKLNQYYGWHQDAWKDPYGIDSHPNLKGKIRKLSVSVSLSDPKDYEGGEFEFDYREQDPDKPQIINKCEELKAQGTILVFPSYTWHRVKPVTKGTRYSLVLWTIGKPFR
jgi:PKHD-type hydroxylase